MEGTRELVCIVCPLGCRLSVAAGAGGRPSVEGASCGRGEEYAVREATDPRRVVPTTVALRGSGLRRLPVKTAAPIPKALIRRCMAELGPVSVDAPVAMGQVVVPDIAGTGVAVVATRSVVAAAGAEVSGA